MRALALMFTLFASPAWAATCEDIEHLGDSYTICTVDTQTETLRLFLNDQNGDPYGNFRNIEASLGVQTLGFAMNAGMYHDSRAPVGHYIEDGVEQMRVIPNAGPGNFGLLPNGILCIHGGGAYVIETLDFLEKEPECRFATQSGPMLVIDGALHPRFIAGGTSRNIRNGVGTSLDGDTAVFAISNKAVNFHDFGTLFRDRLNLPNALYFDGRVSRLHAPQLGRSDSGVRLGPIVGTVE